MSKPAGNVKTNSIRPVSACLSFFEAIWHFLQVVWHFLFTWTQACNQLGTPGGKEFSERGPNFLNYVQSFQTMSNIFLQGEGKFF